MAKKDKKDNKKVDGLSLNKTAKFAVLDLPGVTQPDISAVADATPSSSATNKDGLQGRRAKASTGPRIEGSTLIGGDSFVQRSPNPDWLKTRESIYGKIKERREQELATKTPVDISVVMPDGKELKANKDGTAFQAWKTSPYDVALVISQGLADSATVARVTYVHFVDDYSPKDDGMEGEDTLMDAMQDGGVEDSTKSEQTFLWDMMRPLVGSVAKLELLKFDGDQDAKTVFWHSSAHMLGEALEHLYGCKLTIGPPLAGGFYYDSYMGKDAFREEDCK
jgi:threonyl-tRNA synthetase